MQNNENVAESGAFSDSLTSGRANINNKIKTLKTNKNSYYLRSPEQQISMECSASGVASLRSITSPCSVTSGGPEDLVLAASKFETLIDSTIPANWDYIKLDLFNNATLQDLAKNKNKFTLSISIKLKGHSDWNVYRAGLNGRFRDLKRGLDSATYENQHYTNVKESYKVLKEIYPDLKASKFYEKNNAIKGQTVEDLTTILCPTDVIGEYIVNLHFEDQQWLWKISGKNVTPVQRKKNVVASAGIRRGNKVKNLCAGDLLK